MFKTSIFKQLTHVIFLKTTNGLKFLLRLLCAKFPVISSVKFLLWSISFEGDCRSFEVFQVEFFILKHQIWEHLPKFFLKKLVYPNFW